MNLDCRLLQKSLSGNNRILTKVRGRAFSSSCPIFNFRYLKLKMKAEFQKLIKLFEEFEEAGKTATLTLSTRGG